MKAFIAVLAIIAAAEAGVVGAPGTFLTRAPAFDSAIIKSDRLGGNFAYSVAENHAYAAHTPIVQNVATPVAVSYDAAPVAHAVAAPVHAPVAYAAPASYAAPAAYAAAPVHSYATHAVAGYPHNYGYNGYNAYNGYFGGYYPGGYSFPQQAYYH